MIPKQVLIILLYERTNLMMNECATEMRALERWRTVACFRLDRLICYPQAVMEDGDRYAIFFA